MKFFQYEICFNSVLPYAFRIGNFFYVFMEFFMDDYDDLIKVSF